MWIENIWWVFRVRKIPFSSFRSGAVRRGPFLTNGPFVHTSLRTEKEKNYNYEGCWFYAIALKALWTEKNPTEFGNKLRANRFVFRLFLHAFYKWSRHDQMLHNYCRHFTRLGRLLSSSCSGIYVAVPGMEKKHPNQASFKIPSYQGKVQILHLVRRPFVSNSLHPSRSRQSNTRGLPGGRWEGKRGDEASNRWAHYCAHSNEMKRSNV